MVSRSSRTGSGRYSRPAGHPACGKPPPDQIRRRTHARASENVTVAFPGPSIRPERSPAGVASYTTATTAYHQLPETSGQKILIPELGNIIVEAGNSPDVVESIADHMFRCACAAARFHVPLAALVSLCCCLR